MIGDHRLVTKRGSYQEAIKVKELWTRLRDRQRSIGDPIDLDLPRP